MKLRRAQAQATQSQSELQLLQSQISPHFLFNTLNNLYGIALTEHQKIPPLLLKLSDLLRYSVYEAKESLVPLKHEIDYLKNYIDFEKIRIGDRLDLACQLELVTDERVKIAPMLLIVYIENAFKHAKNTTDQKIFIDLSLKTWNGVILFSIKNSYSPKQHKLFDKHSGLGLTNAKRRLEVLYPSQHTLNIDSDDKTYTVNLQLKAYEPAAH
jgi:LytS/YehU family sensor histidine kinase